MGRVLRRAIGGVLVACLVAASIAFYVYSPYLRVALAGGPPATPGEQRPRTTSSSATPVATPAAPTASPSPRPSTTTAPPPADPTDPGGRQAGIHLVATVRAGQVVDVVETVRLAVPARTLTLAPPDLRDAGGHLASSRPYAEGLVLRADGAQVRSPGTVRAPVVVTLATPADRVELRYTLRGAIVMNKPSAAGRAIGAVAPLLRRMPGDFPVAATFPGRVVRNLSCVRLPLLQQSCIVKTGSRARVNHVLPYRLALFQMQLDMRAAR